MKAEDIRKVVVVGTGTMGQQIALACAIAGIRVAAHDVSEASLAAARPRVAALLEQLRAAGKASVPDPAGVLSRITWTTDAAAAAADADLLSENVPEDVALKRRVFASWHALCPPRTLFTTNTSMLLPSDFAAESGRPEQLVALHFHDLRTTTVVDVMPHPGTAPATVEAVAAFARRLGQSPIVLKRQHTGYLFNNMLNALVNSALTLASNGVAAPMDIDRAWMGVLGYPRGPFAGIDAIGIDTVHHIPERWATQLRDPQQARNAAFLKQYVDRGQLGEKTGKGFYSYPDPEYLQPGFLTGR